MQAAAARAYRKVYVDSAQPARILDELYRGLLDLSREAADRIRARDPAGKGERISRALAVLAELDSALDHRAAPLMCKNLASLYAFVRDRLVQANVHMDPKPLAEIERVIGPLREAFQKIAGG